MTTRPAPWRNLDNQDDRKIAHLAAIARNDTIHGGARAMVIARQCSKWDAAAIVADVYILSTGKHSRHYEAWECPDCGAVHLGMDNAEECCAFSDDDTPSGDLEMAYAENDGDCISDDNWANGTIDPNT
jgi:hypothetical protein